jgi:hypothetical protein
LTDVWSVCCTVACKTFGEIVKKKIPSFFINLKNESEI